MSATVNIAPPAKEQLADGYTVDDLLLSTPGDDLVLRCFANPEGELLELREIRSNGDAVALSTAPGSTVEERLMEIVAERTADDADAIAQTTRFVQGIANRAGALERFERLVEKLAGKMRQSQKPVPGFIVGLSGKDSTLGFLLVYEAASRLGMEHRVLGVHYAHAKRKRPTWYERDVVPWLRERCPKATILVESPLGGNHDQMRWADLHLRALNEVKRDDGGDVVVRSLPEESTYWVVGCTNLTEFELGKFSFMSEKVSVAPLRNVWNSKVLAMSMALGVPDIVIENARLPDCACGRDEIAAANIELIDDILTHEVRIGNHDPELLDQMFAYVRDLRRDTRFKRHTPYLL